MHIYDIGGTLVNLHQITHIRIDSSDDPPLVAYMYLAGQAEPITVQGNDEIDNLISRIRKIST